MVLSIYADKFKVSKFDEGCCRVKLLSIADILGGIVYWLDI